MAKKKVPHEHDLWTIMSDETKSERVILGESYTAAIEYADATGVDGVCMSKQSQAAELLEPADTVIEVPDG